MTYLKLVNDSYQKLLQNNKNPNLAYEILYFLQSKIKNLDDFYRYKDLEVEEQIKNKYLDVVNEFLIFNKPLNRIFKQGYFYHNLFLLDDGVFNFRTETELLVDHTNKLIKQNQWINNVIDVCCGSGVIGLSLKLFNKHINLSLLDHSKKAINNSAKNAKLHNLQNIEFINVDIFKYFNKQHIKYDLLVCNPPYIKPGYLLEDNVLKYDPHDALYDFNNKNGISFYIFILQNIKRIMKSKYKIVFEIGYDQYSELNNYLKTNNFVNYYFIKDYNKQWRILVVSSD